MARSTTLTLAALAVLGLISSVFFEGYASSIVKWIAIGALIASSMRLVLIFGELNLAVGAFVGLGAYAAGAVSTIYGWSFLPSLILSGVFATVIGILFGWVMLRVKGPYFKLIGFAFVEVIRIVYTQSQWLGGNSGIVGIFPPVALDRYMTLFVVAMCAVLIGVLYWVERSHFGKLLVAIRENDAVVDAVGINSHWIKTIAFAIACFTAGLAGGLQAFVNNVISPGDFSYLLSVFALAYLKIGGEDSPVGPVLGAILLILLGIWATSFGAGEHIFYGAAIVLTVLFMPKGMVGLARTWLPSRNGTTRSAVAPKTQGEMAH